jgi:hypothetical protein
MKGIAIQIYAVCMCSASLISGSIAFVEAMHGFIEMFFPELINRPIPNPVPPAQEQQNSIASHWLRTELYIG